MTRCFQFITIRSGSSVLPNYCMVNRFAGGAFPDYRCLPLVSDTDASHLPHGDIGFGNRFSHRAILCTPYFFCVMFYPPGLRKDLPKFFLGNTDYIAMFVEQHASATGCALVERKN